MKKLSLVFLCVLFLSPLNVEASDDALSAMDAQMLSMMTKHKQMLQDLKASRDAGSLTEADYQAQVKQLNFNYQQEMIDVTMRYEQTVAAHKEMHKAESDSTVSDAAVENADASILSEVKDDEEMQRLNQVNDEIVAVVAEAGIEEAQLEEV